MKEMPGSALIIDDDVDFCSLVCMVVKKEGFEANCAYRLTDAPILIDSLNPDMILLDNNLPDGTGIQFFMDNKELFTNRRVFMVTADPSEALKGIAIEHGVEFFYSKPLMLAEFQKLLHQCMHP